MVVDLTEKIAVDIFDDYLYRPFLEELRMYRTISPEPFIAAV